MNHNKKTAAVSKYSKLHKAGASEAEIIKEMTDAGFTSDEAAEVYEAITVPTTVEPEIVKVSAPKAAPGKPSTFKKFERWKAKPIYKWRINEDTGERERIMVSVEKIGAAPLSVHHIEQRQADELNSQVENIGFYHFEIEA